MNDLSGVQSSLNGIQRGMDSFRQNSQTVADQQKASQPSEKEVSEAIVGINQDRNQVEASTKTLKAHDDNLGNLLDEMA